MARLHCHTRNRWSRNEARHRRRRVVGLVTAAATLLAATITVSGPALADSLPRGTACSIDANGRAGPAAAIGDGDHATAPGGSGGDGGSGGSGGAGGKGGPGAKAALAESGEPAGTAGTAVRPVPTVSPARAAKAVPAAPPGHKAERLASTANPAARAGPGEIGRGPSRRGCRIPHRAGAVITESARRIEAGVGNG
jgi:hypothetical protein